MDKAAERASNQLEAKQATPLPEGLSPHKLRHTYCSILVALGTDPGAIMDQIGHSNPNFTLRVYRHAMRRDQASKDQLKRLVGAEVEAPEASSGTNSGTNGQNGDSLTVNNVTADETKARIRRAKREHARQDSKCDSSLRTRCVRQCTPHAG
jgi:hypothetical protein